MYNTSTRVYVSGYYLYPYDFICTYCCYFNRYIMFCLPATLYRNLIRLFVCEKLLLVSRCGGLDNSFKVLPDYFNKKR